MRRKDILIIAAILIVIAFGAVLFMYYAINSNTHTKVTEEIIETAKKEYHSNGWETAIVDKIVDKTPIPVGFTYIEGKQNTGIIIEDNITKEKYMWIPNQDIEKDIYEETIKKLYLIENNENSKQNIQKYGGFYVAIDERTTEEKYDEYLKQTVEDYETYKTLKEKGYEEYKKEYEEQTGKEIDLNNYEITEEEYNSLKEVYNSATTILETHVITLEEKMLIEQMSKNLNIEINIKDYKAMTLSASINTQNNTNIEQKIQEKGYDPKIIGDIKNEVPIPRGFEYKEGTPETGLKIKNGDNLSFIWIPVEDIEKVRENFEEIMVQADIEKELIENYRNYTDDIENTEYKALVESIKKYGGFYISEAELGYDRSEYKINKYREMYSTQGTEILDHVANGDYYRWELTYENAVSICKELYGDSETVVSHLGYGLEYDATILYLLNNCNKVNAKNVFTDSTKIGKYQYYMENQNAKQSLWEKEDYLNGIYGLAGNLSELTQERDGENLILRGGSWNVVGNYEPLASKISTSEEEINFKEFGDEDEAGHGTVGIRAFLYIKTEYEENQELIKLKEDAKSAIVNHINNAVIYIGDQVYYKLNTKVNGEYEIQAINKIIECVNKEIDAQTSSEVITKIATSANNEMMKILRAIEVIKYPGDINKIYTYGEINEECLNIKINAIEQVKKLVWNNWKYEQLTPLQLLENTEKKIEDTRKAEKERVYKEEIEDYISNNYKDIENKNEVKELKQEAKSEIMFTEDLTNIKNISKKYQEKLVDIEKSFIKIGDYVSYKPNMETAYQFEKGFAGDANFKMQTIEYENLKWRVLNINKDGTIDLISEKPTEQELILGGAIGYNNGVYLLNDICEKLYSNNNIGAVARSINIDDVKSKTVDGYVFARVEEGQYIDQNYICELEGKHYYPYLLEKEKVKGEIDGKTIEGTLEESDINSLIVKAYKTTEKGMKITENYWSCDLNNDLKKVESRNNNSTNNIYSELLTGNYYVATRCRKTYFHGGDKSIEFGIFRIEDTTVDNGNLCSNNDNFFVEEGSLRPIVNIPISRINLESDYDQKGTWELKK